MGIVLKASKTLSDEVQEIVTLYSEMIRTRRRIEAGAADHERVRYTRLEIKVDQMWIGLDRSKQLQAVGILVENGFMTQTTADALVVFDGKIDFSPLEEPCLKLTPENCAFNAEQKGDTK